MRTKDTNILSALKNSILFSNLPEEQIALFADKAKISIYKKGFFLWQEKETNTGLFILISGLLKVVITDEDGQEFTINLLNPTDCFGEMSLLDNKPHSASVIALEDSKCLVITKKDFIEIMHREPEVVFNLFKILTERARFLSQQIADLSFKNIYHRVARKLLHLYQINNRNEITITHQELAKMVNATRENVTRVLKTMANENLLTIQKQLICIKDLNKLTSIML